MCLKIGLLHSLSEPGFTDFSANSGRPERVRLPVLPLSGHVGVGFLLHAGRALFAVGVRREHLLHGGGFGAFRQFDQLIERVGHAVGVEPVFHAEFEAVFVGFVLLLLRELCIGEGRYDFAQLRFAQPGQSAAFGGSGGIAGCGCEIGVFHGVFRVGMPSADELARVTPQMALRHPTWSMGGKITIDSSTLFNKGLELMEAGWLFDIEPNRIEILIHPQSVVHSMVEFCDGAVFAQMSPPDMRLAIQYALTYPHRITSQLPRLDLAALHSLTFEKPDCTRFPAISLAYDAFRDGSSLPIAYNSANETAVELFVRGCIGFTDIAKCVEYSMERIPREKIGSVDDILYLDKEARRLACECFGKETL